MKISTYSMFFLLVVLLVGFSGPVLADSYSDTIGIFKQSPRVQPYFKNAYGYVVFPTVGKGAFVVGGAYGKGQVYRKGTVTGTASAVRVSIGPQAGGQAYSQIVFLQDKRAYDEFTKGEFAVDATLSAVAITAGAQAQASTAGATAGASAGPATSKQAKTNYRKGRAIFIHTKGGFMLEASFGGQGFSFTPKK